jgi:hypothetical protein
MALDDVALIEVLEAGGVDDRVRTAAPTISQALTDAELTNVGRRWALGTQSGADDLAQRLAARGR